MTPKAPLSKQAAENRARNTRAVKIGVCFIFAAGALRFTILKPDSGTVGDSGVAPVGAEASTEKLPLVTSLPIDPVRDPFWPVNGG
ncbi:MAG: hypothetical protein ABI658_12155 [Acidimicrobiales bacterium]